MIWLWYINDVDLQQNGSSSLVSGDAVYFQYHSTNEMCVLAVYKKRRESPLSIVGGHQKYYALYS
jgi:hypothetical protein